MILAGIDHAWACTKNPTAIVIGTCDGGILQVTDVQASVLSVDGILERLLGINGLTGVAIDASLIIPNVTGQRTCERELSAHYGKMGASCHASNLTLYPDAASVALSKKLEVRLHDPLQGATVERVLIQLPHRTAQARR